MNNRKYPVNLFLMGLIANIVFRYFYLFVPALILLILGIRVRELLYVGLCLLSIDIIISIVEQLRMRKTLINDNDNPNFTEFQDLITKDDNWSGNIKDFVNAKIAEDSKRKINSGR